MIVMGKYIYGVMNGSTAFRLYAENNPLYTISYQDIAAIVSDSEVVDYTHMRKDALARLLVSHQQAIEGIMALGNMIIPMRLGTFAQDEAEVKDILYKGYDLIKAALEKTKGKVEIDVVATWSDFPSVLKKIGQEKEIREFKEQALSNPKSITIDDQMKAGLMVKKALDEKKENCAKRIHDALSGLAQGHKLHELMNDTMIMNTAFLIDKANQKELDEKLSELDKEFHEELNFRCVGPLPPYSFYTLEMKRLDFNEIVSARQKLGIEEDSAGKAEIKKAYQAKAVASHPDKHPDGAGMEDEFGETNKAYKMLLEYCESCGHNPQTQRCSFKEEDFKRNAVLVRLKG